MKLTLVRIIGLFFITFSISYLGIFAVRWLALKHRIMDIPNERSSHDRPIPLGGGMTIVVLTLAGVIVCGYGLLDSSWDWSEILVYVVGAFIIASSSLVDDIRSLPNRVRFASHSLGAILVIWGFGYWDTISLPFLGQLHLGWFGIPITFFWIVGLINAYNFMDGIDGIAGGQAIVAGLGWAFFGWINEQTMVGLIGLILASSSLGFLFHNWPPARIFMGDVGSAFLGFNFAVLSIAAAQSVPRMELFGVLLVWPFVFDTFFTFFRRLRSGENIFSAHRSHLYQRLVIIGYKHSSVTLLYIGLALIGLFLAFIFISEKEMTDWLTVIGLILVASCLWLFISWQEYRHRSFST